VIGVLDYGIGNLRSAEKALQHLGADAALLDDPDRAASCSGMVLPGVGSFGRCAQALRASGLDKAALFAIEKLFDELPARLPVMISVTITDASGRTLSGQTLEAFYNSIAHARPFSVGINCALGAKQMRPYIEELAHLASCYVTCYPNAGLPNAFGGYDETPAEMAATLAEFAANGWVNLLGGCCGSTPAHINAIATAVKDLAPRQLPSSVDAALHLSGLEPLTVA